MKKSLRDLSSGTFVPMLHSLQKILDKASQQAVDKGIDLAALPNARLAPDMFPLTRQVQIACDSAKNATARLTGREPPRFEDNEQTLDDLKARIARTIDYIQSAPTTAFDGADDPLAFASQCDEVLGGDPVGIAHDDVRLRETRRGPLGFVACPILAHPNGEIDARTVSGRGPVTIALGD